MINEFGSLNQKWIIGDECFFTLHSSLKSLTKLTKTMVFISTPREILLP